MLRFTTLPTRRFFTSTISSSILVTTNRRNQTTTNNNNNNDDDDDFVANSAFLHAADSSSESASTSASSSSDLAIRQPLGIERLPQVPEGLKISRLNNVVTSKPAPNVPSRRQMSMEKPTPAEISQLLAREERLKQLGEEGKSFTFLSSEEKQGGILEAIENEIPDENAAAEQQEDEEEEVFSNEPLPYDSTNYAETILRMEVEGAIDETWQDTIQAKPEDVAEIVEVLKDSRARDIVAIDVRTKTSNFDFIVVATCESQRHMTLASWSVSEADKWNRISKPSRRKADELWEVVPVGRILVNLMIESYRNEVTVERKWAVTKSMDPLDAAHTRISEGRQVRMHGLWTLTMNLQDLEDFEIDYCKDVLLSQL